MTSLANNVERYGAAAGLTLAGLTIALLFGIWGRDSKLPNIEKLSDYHPSQVSRVLSSDGAVVGEIYTKRRTYVPFERIPKKKAGGGQVF